jgi:hypothetical protein|tara:strand:+ start:321 stop:599 length:279 start_codon:yes stop_codon:yes gene_type:complete
MSTLQMKGNYMSRFQDEHDDDIEEYEDGLRRRKNADVANNIRTLGFGKAHEIIEKQREYWHKIELTHGREYARAQQKLERQMLSRRTWSLVK